MTQKVWRAMKERIETNKISTNILTSVRSPRRPLNWDDGGGLCGLRGGDDVLRGAVGDDDEFNVRPANKPELSVI